jgi:hypothetical protein
VSDTTKLIPPPRRGPRWIDLVLAAVAGALLVLVVLGVLTRFPARLAGATPSPSLTASPSSTSSPSPSITIVIQTAAPTTEAPSATPSPAPTTAPPTPAPTTPPPTGTPRPTNTPNPTKSP